MLLGNQNTRSDNNISSPYPLQKFDHGVTFQYNTLFQDIEKHQQNRHEVKKDINSILLRERITGKAFSDQEGVSYLDNNALTRGENEEIDKSDYLYKSSIINTCGKNVVWLQGTESGMHYIKEIKCRKQWCPICGGSGGEVHKSRVHSLINRFDVEKYNLRQFVFTVPESLRESCKSRQSLDWLFGAARQVIERHFGQATLDKHGHVKKWKLVNGVIAYLHVFGEQTGVFKPHINIHIIENSEVKLKLSETQLNSIKKLWLKKLQVKFGYQSEVINVYYSFRIGVKKVVHALKYMARPWNDLHFHEADQDLKELLVLGMSGFNYMRYWGLLSNSTYKDQMTQAEIKQEVEKKIDEPLTALFIAPFDKEKWKNYIIELDEGLYLCKYDIYYIENEVHKMKMRLKNEPEKTQGKAQ